MVNVGKCESAKAAGKTGGAIAGGFGMELRGMAAAVAAAIAIAGALTACAAPGGSATATTALTPSAIFAHPAAAPRAPDIKDLAGLKPNDVLSMLGKPDLKRAEPPAELWQYRAADCVLNLFFYSDAGGAHLTHAEAWQRTLAGGSSPARCHDEDAPIKAHLISQSSF
jgi:hypothetical protein